MKKTTLLLVAILLVSVLTFASCNLFAPDNKECTEHVDADGNYICDNCEAELEKNDTPETPVCEHKDENNDHKCDACEEVISECVATEGGHDCAICGKTLSECVATEGGHDCAICGKALSECVATEGGHDCAICGKALSECSAAADSHNCAICGKTLSQCADENGNFACDICGADMIPDTHEKVEYSLNISDLVAEKLTADSINGKFTIVSGSEIRNRTKTFEGVEYNKSVKIGNSTTKIKVDVPGAGKLSFIIQNGSSSGAETQFVTVTGPDGTVYNIEFAGTNEGSPLVRIELAVTEGTWVISRGKNGGTQDVFALSLSAIVAKSDENGFELVSEGTVNYLVGQELDFSGIRLNSIFANGKTDPLAIENVTIDTSAVITSTDGVYPVVISYKNYAPITIYVKFFAPTLIELGFDAIEKLSQNTSYGNGVYYNHSFKELYFVNEEFDASGLTVYVVGICGEEGMKFKTSDYKIEGFDSSYSDFNKITISAFGVSTDVELHIVDTVPAPNEKGVYQLLVDPAYIGIAGAISGPYHVFKTIQSALEYAEYIDKAATKELYIAPGYYSEKLEITVPNLKIVGWGETPDEVIIEWNSLYGLVDEGGFTHTTDSTQTVAIRESAYNVTIENITISNYWNSQDRMDAADLEIERGLALLVQADRFVMKNSKLLGIQDTLELFTGRQYFENVYISGYTDFIFGTNNVTLFKNCTIHVIDTAKDDKGTAGYITAFKGSNKGAADAIVYGAIFDGCKFTADEGVTKGCTAIGRTWGAYAAVAVINSELGGHISTAGYNPSNNKNTRYISMNGIHPTDSTVQFVEYNNTGDGAITEAVAGMRFLTAEEAALYVDFATIFGTINGKVTFLDPWNPESTEVVTDDRTYYYFNGTEGTSGTSYTYTENVQGATLEWNGLLIDATAGKLTSRGSDAQFNAGAKIIFNVEAGTLVTVISYPGYGYYTINGIAHSANDTFSVYFAGASEVVIESTATSYIYQIIINPNEDAPQDPTLTEIKVSGLNTNYKVGEELNLADAVVKAYYSDFSIVNVNAKVDTSAVNNAVAGSYDVIFSYAGKTVTVTVTFEDPNADPAITESTVLDFTTEAGLEAVQNNPRVTMDGSIRFNGAEIQIKGTISFQVKAGTVITVIPYANEQYASYTIGEAGEENLVTYNTMMSTMFSKDCTVVYTGLDNNYLCQIIIECPIGEGKYVFGGSSVEGDVTGILESIPGMSISGTFNTHSGGAQMGESSQIIFIAPALATVTVKGYDTSYGQLLVLVDGVPVEMNANAEYVFTPSYAATVVIEAVNVGTEEAPAWNKSYITYIDVELPTFIAEDLTVSFGSAGNYKDCGIDFSGITIGDNGGNNSQIKNGSFSFAVKAGATISVHAYPGYASYNFIDGDAVYEGITDEYFNYEVTSDCVIVISHTEGNNYFYSISIVYPVEVVKESFTVSFGSEGNYKEGHDAVDLSNIQIGDNGGNNSQVKNGYMTIQLSAGAKVTINGYPGYTSYKLSAGEGESDEITDQTYVFTADADCTLTITPVSGNNYFYSIAVEY